MTTTGRCGICGHTMDTPGVGRCGRHPAERPPMKPTDIPATITAATSKRETFPSLCQWFLKCTNPAEYLVPHPVLGDVSACGRCVDKLGLETAGTVDPEDVIDAAWTEYAERHPESSR